MGTHCQIKPYHPARRIDRYGFTIWPKNFRLTRWNRFVEYRRRNLYGLVRLHKPVSKIARARLFVDHSSLLFGPAHHAGHHCIGVRYRIRLEIAQAKIANVLNPAPCSIKPRDSINLNPD